MTPEGLFVLYFYTIISAGEIRKNLQAEAKQPMPSGSAGATCAEINRLFHVAF